MMVSSSGRALVDIMAVMVVLISIFGLRFKVWLRFEVCGLGIRVRG